METPLPSIPGKINFERLEKKYKHLIESAYNLRQSDDSLSDVFYYEAEKVQTQLRLFHSKFISN